MRNNSKTGEVFTIIEYFNCSNITIKFSDGTVTRNKRFGDIKRGQVQSPNFPSTYNTGFLGQGKYSQFLNKKIYQTWEDMMARGYSIKVKGKYPTYKDCTVDKDWHNFQNFAKWYEGNYVENFHLDKDILVPGNKVYGPDTCCFVPHEINKVFVTRSKKENGLPKGVMRSGKKFISQYSNNGKTIYLGTFSTIIEAFKIYKETKEEHIRLMANKFKPLITPECYTAMYNYKVEITD